MIYYCDPSEQSVLLVSPNGAFHLFVSLRFSYRHNSEEGSAETLPNGDFGRLNLIVRWPGQRVAV